MQSVAITWSQYGQTLSSFNLPLETLEVDLSLNINQAEPRFFFVLQNCKSLNDTFQGSSEQQQHLIPVWLLWESQSGILTVTTSIWMGPKKT